MSENLNLAIETRFRSKSLEIRIVSYFLKKNIAPIFYIESSWFGSEFLKVLVNLLKEVKTSLSRDTLEVLLQQRNIGDSKSDLIKLILDEIYAVDVSKMSEAEIMEAMSELLNMSESRSILYGIRDIILSIKKNLFDVRTVKERLRQLGRPAALVDQNNSGNYLETYESRLDYIRKKADRTSSGLSVGILTGIRAFDRMTGGIMQGEFGVIGGKPSIGKTACLISFGVNAWQPQRKCVIFVTGEMPRRDIEFRIDSMISGIPAMHFRLGTLSEDHFKDWEEVIKTERSQSDNYFEIVSLTKGFSVESIESEVLKIQDKYKKAVDLVCLDYINLVHPKKLGFGKSAKDWSAQSDVVWEFKDFISTFNGGIGGWTAGQLIDSALEKDTLTLGDLKYSRAISETAPVVVGLTRTEQEELEHTMELQILKMRNAPLPEKNIILRPNLSVMKIHEEVLGYHDLIMLGEDTTPRRFKNSKHGNFKQ